MTIHNETLSQNLNKQKQWMHKVNQELASAGEAAEKCVRELGLGVRECCKYKIVALV